MVITARVIQNVSIIWDPTHANVTRDTFVSTLSIALVSKLLFVLNINLEYISRFRLACVANSVFF